MTWQRARQPEQKAARIGRILEAAGTLFDERDHSAISMQDIARHAGVGKASLYQYFSTREEVFLALYRSELDKWLPDLEIHFGRMRSPSAKRVAAVLTKIASKHCRLCGLTAIFSSVLEQNVSEDFITSYKFSLLETMGRTIRVLQSRLPNLSDSKAQEFLIQHHALIAGLWPLANPSEVVGKAMMNKELEGLRVNFCEVLETALEKLLT